MGKEKAEKFIRDLAAQKPILVESLLPAAERVATGETPIAITYVKYVYILRSKRRAARLCQVGKIHGRWPLSGLKQQSAPCQRR